MLWCVVCVVLIACCLFASVAVVFSCGLFCFVCLLRVDLMIVITGLLVWG